MNKIDPFDTNFDKENRKNFARDQLEKQYNSGLFRRDVVILDEVKWNLTFDQYELKLNQWRDRTRSGSEIKLSDAHKVAAFTAIAINDNKPLYLNPSYEKVQALEAICNEYFALLMAISRLSQDYEFQRKHIQFNPRELASYISGFRKNHWSSDILSHHLHLYEKLYLANFQSEIVDK